MNWRFSDNQLILDITSHCTELKTRLIKNSFVVNSYIRGKVHFIFINLQNEIIFSIFSWRWNIESRCFRIGIHEQVHSIHN